MTMIESLTLQGLGRTTEGDFVPRVLPGETVEVLEDGSARILTPSADRVSPPCRHFKSCGGCALQHASDSFVSDWKASIVQRALTAQGLPSEIRSTRTSPPQSRRRAKLSGKRTKKGALVGFHARGSDLVIAVPECKLLSPGLMAKLPALEDLVVIAASRKAEVGLTVTDSREGIDILVTGGVPLTQQLRIALAEFAQTHNIARLVWEDEPVVTRHLPYQRFGSADVVPPAGAFLQATAQGEADLLASVREAVGAAGKIVDLFAGCGTFTLPLAVSAEVHAVEGLSEMMRALDDGWRKGANLKLVTTETRDLFRRPLEPDELKPFKAAVIDPPRAGAEAQIATLAASVIPRIAMVSCNPVTFARDAKTLVSAGYSMDWVDVVDQFRWSTHIEMAAQFTKA